MHSKPGATSISDSSEVSSLRRCAFAAKQRSVQRVGEKFASLHHNISSRKFKRNINPKTLTLLFCILVSRRTSGRQGGRRKGKKRAHNGIKHCEWEEPGGKEKQTVRTVSKRSEICKDERASKSRGQQGWQMQQ